MMETGVPTFVSNILDYLFFLIERLNWLSILDILLVTAVFFVILLVVRDTQAIVLLARSTRLTLTRLTVETCFLRWDSAGS